MRLLLLSHAQCTECHQADQFEEFGLVSAARHSSCDEPAALAEASSAHTSMYCTPLYQVLGDYR